MKITENTLYEKTKHVTAAELPEVLRIATEIKEWIKNKPAYAVAFNQLGFEFNCFVVKGNKLGIIDNIIINPSFEPQKKSKEIISVEYCLSFPGQEFRIKRFNKIIFYYFNEKLESRKWKMHGMHSVICQHEISHLAGFPDNTLHIEDNK